jgi:predicted neuraminidase
MILEDESGQEFTCPAVIQTKDGLGPAVYTWNRRRIQPVVVEPGKLELKLMENGNWPR